MATCYILELLPNVQHIFMSAFDRFTFLCNLILKTSCHSMIKQVILKFVQSLPFIYAGIAYVHAHHIISFWSKQEIMQSAEVVSKRTWRREITEKKRKTKSCLDQLQSLLQSLYYCQPHYIDQDTKSISQED